MGKIKKQNVIVIIVALLSCVGMVSCGDDDTFIVGKPSNIFSNLSPKITAVPLRSEDFKIIS